MKSIVHRLPLALLSLGITGLLIVSGQLLARHVQVQAGQGAVPAPDVASAYAEEPAKTGRFDATLTYTSLDAPGNGEATARVTWDDAWFSQDERAYNGQLAHAASVLAALAYSESGYYQAGASCPPYMENALVKLGFSDISTDSYQYRSEAVDEVLNLMTAQADGVAYTIARKHLAPAAGPDGAQAESASPADSASAGAAPSASRDLILVSVRGSYGSEWLSNLDLSSDESGDHGGYVRAAREIEREVARWAMRSRADGAEVSVLLAGHSRGGAVANLVATELDNARGDSELDGMRVYGYTFASPATTLHVEARDERYGNIFNVINPSDIMPYLPLSSWGYERYGVDVSLPTIDDEDFESRRSAMEEAYERSVGVACAADPEDARTAQAVCDDIAARIPSAAELVSPAGAAAVFGSAAAHVDPVRMLYSHYPSTYAAWLDVLAE